MKVAVVTNCVPFVSGGAEHLAAALGAKLASFGHESVLIRIPFRWEPQEKILESMLACRLLRLPNVDRVVALKFPAYYVPHGNKVLWLLHQFRQAYDLWGTDLQGMTGTPEGQEIRQIIMRSDREYLREARAIFTNSRVTSQRLKTFNGLDSEVLWPPLAESAHFHCAGYEDFIFCPSRVNAAKRQHLLVEAMRFVKSGARLILAGLEEEPGYRARIEDMMRSVPGRVEWRRGFIPESEKAELLSRALACAYVPYDEDSYGYVTLEAFWSRKAVITCRDSGGTDVLVRDGQTGFVVEPSARDIARAIDQMYDSRSAARAMGEAGRDLVESLGITWERVISRLTQ